MIAGRLFVAICALTLVACQDATVEPGPEVVASVVVEPAAAAAFLETIDAYGSVDFATQQARILDSAAEVIVEQILVSPGQSVGVGDPFGACSRAGMLARVRAFAVTSSTITQRSPSLPLTIVVVTTTGTLAPFLRTNSFS